MTLLPDIRPGRLVAYRVGVGHRPLHEHAATTGTGPDVAWSVGDVWPAHIVEVRSNGHASLRVYVDGDSFPVWVPDVEQGDGPGTWSFTAESVAQHDKRLP